MTSVRLRAAFPAAAPAADPRSPLVATAALTVTVACGCLLVLIPAAFLLHPSRHLPGIFANLGDQNQNVKTTLYLVAFLVVVPVSLLVVPRIVDRVGEGPNRRALSPLAALLPAALALAIVLARISFLFPWGNGVVVVLVAACCWWLVAVAMVGRAIRPEPWHTLIAAARFAPVLALGAGVAVVGAVLCVTALHRLSATALVLGTIVLVGSVLVYGRARLPSLTGPPGVALDLLIVVVLLLAIPDLAIFKAARTPALTQLNAIVIGGQENYLLGPANQLLAGGTMLVDTVSQYGVGSIYFLAGWFHLAPIGYGTLGFLDGLLTALVYVASYCLLRLAGVSRLLAVSALALGVIALLYNLTYPVGALAEHGPLRFGLPMAAILAVVIGFRVRGRARPLARWAVLAVIAVASIWSLEAFAYTLFALACMAGVRAAVLNPGTRRRWLVSHGIQTAAAAAIAHLILAGATLAATGQLPDWGQYFAYFHAFLFGSVAKLTYGFARWSPGLAVGALYLASAVAIVLVIWRAPSVLRREARALIALAGTTAYGIALFSYFDNRSATYLLLYVALPALLTAVLWLSVLLRLCRESAPNAGQQVLAFALSVGAVVLAAAWSPTAGRLSDSALAHVLPGGPSLRGALHRLWHPPALDPRALEGQRLLARYLPGQRRSLVLTIDAPDLGTEILIRSRRGDLLPLGDPVEDSIVPSVRLPVLQQAIARLRPGDRLLMNQSARAYLIMLRTHPSFNPVATSNAVAPGLEESALKQISQRFRLLTLDADRQGFIVAELAPR